MRPAVAAGRPKSAFQRHFCVLDVHISYLGGTGTHKKRRAAATVAAARPADAPPTQRQRRAQPTAAPQDEYAKAFKTGSSRRQGKA